jgi:hypothetical protein
MTEQPTAPTTPAEAATRLDALKQDATWSRSFLDGLPAQMKEYQGLRAMIDKSENVAVDMAMAGEYMGMNTPEHIEMMGAASMLRQAGVRDEIVRDVLAGSHVVSKDEFAKVKQFKADKMTDPAWTKRLLSGDSEATREFHLMNIILTGGVEDKAA